MRERLEGGTQRRRGASVAFAFWAFGRAGLAGTGALAAIGAWSTTILFALLGVWEIVALAGIGQPHPSDELCGWAPATER